MRGARRMGARLAALEGAAVDLAAVETNMIFARVSPEDADPLKRFADARGVTLGPGPTFRLVAHLDLDDAGEQAAVQAFEAFFAMGEPERRV